MDPVGKEDKDIDNDGDHDSTDKYLLKRRKAIGKAIAKKRGKVKEGFSAWRIDLDFNEQVKKVKGGLVSPKSPNCIVMPEKEGAEE